MRAMLARAAILEQRHADVSHHPLYGHLIRTVGLPQPCLTTRGSGVYLGTGFGVHVRKFEDSARS